MNECEMHHAQEYNVNKIHMFGVHCKITLPSNPCRVVLLFTGVQKCGGGDVSSIITCKSLFICERVTSWNNSSGWMKSQSSKFSSENVGVYTSTTRCLMRNSAGWNLILDTYWLGWLVLLDLWPGSQIVRETYGMITNDMSDYINLLVRIAYITCNHPLLWYLQYPESASTS
jgi:hypothetical protein